MRAGQTQLEVNTLIQVLSITDDDPDEMVGVVGATGKITHPFGDQPNTIAGVWVEERGIQPAGVRFPHPRIGLCNGDRIKVLETGEEIIL